MMSTENSIVAGLIGTAAMTLLVEIIALAVQKPYHVILILARMLSFKKHVRRPEPVLIILATAIHFVIGIVFAILYYQLLDNNIIQLDDLYSAALYGVFIGSIGAVGWLVFFKIHPDPPGVGLPGYLVTILLGHVCFATTVFFYNNAT